MSQNDDEGKIHYNNRSISNALIAGKGAKILVKGTLTCESIRPESYVKSGNEIINAMIIDGDEGEIVVEKDVKNVERVNANGSGLSLLVLLLVLSSLWKWFWG